MENQGDKQGDWQTVSRRKQGTDDWSRPIQGLPNTFTPFLTQPTYAEAVRRRVPSPKETKTRKATPSPTRTPSPPFTPTSAAFYVSPHNPSNLRFPPSPHFPEWKGRCFQCCRTGHTTVTCKNPKRCGRCWGTGHTGSKCRLQPWPTVAHITVTTPPSSPKPPKGEPDFEELLREPLIRKPMPKGRPLQVGCYMERDQLYHEEMAKLDGTVVMYNP